MPISKDRAALAGLIYALVMTGWIWWSRDVEVSELAWRFVLYGTVFGTLFYLLMNWLARRSARKD